MQANQTGNGETDGTTRLDIEGGIATIRFDRPAARNAMTWPMYEALETACQALREREDIHVVVLRGVGGKAFVAGTDIAQFLAFKDGQDGVAYEHRLDAIVSTVEALPMPTVAVVEHWAVGAGLVLANACDFRLATPGSRFGAPIARTVGNCLSAANVQRLVRHLGETVVARMLMLGELLPAESLPPLYLDLVAADAVEQRLQGLCDTVRAHAPLTVHAAKAALVRTRGSFVPQDDDIVARVYGSADFREGVRAFTAREAPRWQGG